MKTLIFEEDVTEAAEIIKQGGLCAVPTETVYGLAGNGLDAAAVERIYEVKGRPSVKPLSLMVSGIEDIEKYSVSPCKAAYILADKFWPGPLTIVLNAADFIPAIVLAGGNTVGLRCPDSALTLSALKKAQVPFAAPSANPSGAPSPKNAQDVLNYFDGEIEGVIDGGECTLGTESTIISMVSAPYKILRQGALPAEDIADILVENMRIIGITGGSGTGKTTALRALEKSGALIIDCDALYHNMLSDCKEMVLEIAAQFPESVTDGKIDRKKLGAEVFADSAKLSRLNEITHAYIAKEIRRLLRGHAMNGGELAAIDAVELISSGLGDICSITVGVLAGREERLSRIIARDNISRQAAEARIDAQRSDDYYRNNCTVCIYNNADENEFSDAFLNTVKGE